MDLDIKQTRRWYLSGTVAFPTPFPSAGGISVEDGAIIRSEGTGRQTATFVVVQEEATVEQSTIRVVLDRDVAAIFFPGEFVDTDQGREFRFAEKDGVDDLEKGEWFVNPDIDAAEISKRLGVDIGRRNSGARGIAFCPRTWSGDYHERTYSAGGRGRGYAPTILRSLLT